MTYPRIFLRKNLLLGPFIPGLIYVLCVLTALTFLACSTKENKPSPFEPTPPEEQTQTSSFPKEHSSPEARFVAVETGASIVEEISFSKSSNKLSSTSKSKISLALKNAEKKGQIRDVKIISWSDSEYPAADLQKLAEKDLDLAVKRNKSIKSFVLQKSHPTRKFKIETYNMAERPNTLQSLLGTSDAQIKHSLESAGISTTENLNKKTKKSSRAFLMITLDTDVK